MKLDKVTLTGADCSIDPHDLFEISETFPFVEWGILVSRNNSFNGANRFPSVQWIKDLMGDVDRFTMGTRFGPKLQFSCHICGSWVRDIFTECNEHTAVMDEWPWLLPFFQRVQLNTHGEKGHKYSKKTIFDIEGDRRNGRQVIFQMDGVNQSLLGTAASMGINAVPLYDMSCGAGIVPKQWPMPFENHLRHPNITYFGYAGGLGPDNLGVELPRIAEAAGDSQVWIDMETLIRSNSDQLFDLDKCTAVLEYVRDNCWIAKE